LSNKLKLEGLSDQEATKALIESGSFALVARYARCGTDRHVLQWLGDKLRLIAGELNRNKKMLDEQDSPPTQGKIIRVQQKKP
jgi:hypothetical protein